MASSSAALMSLLNGTGSLLIRGTGGNSSTPGDSSVIWAVCWPTG